METQKIDNLAMAAASLVSVKTQNLVSQWRDQLALSQNVKVSPTAYGVLLLEAAIFGHYCVLLLMDNHLKEEDKKTFEVSLREDMIHMLGLLLDSDNKSTDAKAHENNIREMYEMFMPRIHEIFRTNDGGSSLGVLRARLRDTFNNMDEFGITFVKKSFVVKILLNIEAILAGNDEKRKDVVYLYDDVIYILADSLYKEFTSITFQTLNSIVNKQEG